MQFSLALLGSLLGVAGAIPAILPGGTPYPPLTPCTKQTRLAIAMNIIEAFNDPNDLNSIATLQNAPFKPNGFIDLYVS